MTILPFALSLRTRLLLAGVLVNAAMLALLIVNSIGIMDEKLHERTRIHLEEQKQLLNAALSGRWPRETARRSVRYSKAFAATTGSFT